MTIIKKKQICCCGSSVEACWDVTSYTMQLTSSGGIYTFTATIYFVDCDGNTDYFYGAASGPLSGGSSTFTTTRGYTATISWSYTSGELIYVSVTLPNMMCCNNLARCEGSMGMTLRSGLAGPMTTTVYTKTCGST